MTHERLNILPVEHRVTPQVGPAAARHPPAEHGLRAAVDALELPAILRRREHQVMSLDDAAAGDVDQVAAEHVGGQEHLPGSPLEGLRLQRVRVEAHRARLELRNQVLADEHVLRADANLEAGHRWIAALGQLDDEVLDPPDLGAGGVQHRASQPLRDHHAALALTTPRLIHVPILLDFTHRNPSPTTMYD